MTKKYTVWRKYITGNLIDFIVSWNTNNEYKIGQLEKFMDGNCIIIDIEKID